MFFSTIHQMMTEGVDLTIVIRKSNGQMTVSVLPKSNGLKDDAQHHIVPLTLTGMPQELDAGFLSTISQPIQRATGLITNMAHFEAQADKAAANSKAAKEAKSKETKEQKEKREKYEKHFKRAQELIAEENHKDAIAELGQARMYADTQMQAKIAGMIAEQKDKMSQGSLFAVEDEEPAPQAQPVQQPIQQPVQQPVQQRPMPAQPQGVQMPHQTMPQQPTAHPHQTAPQPIQRQHPQQAPPPQPQYFHQPQQPYYPHQQMHMPPPPEEYAQQYQAECSDPPYRPEDYEEYLDFPQSMLDGTYQNHVQTS